jgi:pimeloyl-ACP methyl ester carboxylesterase
MTSVSIRFSAQLLRLLAVACVLLACGSSVSPASDDEEDDAAQSEDASTRRDDDSPHAHDRAVDVFEAGAGDVTVVFESGLGNDWTPWQQVADEVASKARVFAYSRPGYGHSDPTDEPRDASHIVEHLRTLLAERGYAPPYVLVGHSFGGAYMELFAKAHPEEVVGLVLVDSRHRDFTSACEQGGYEGCAIPESLVSMLPPVQLAEYREFAKASDEIRAAGSFGSYPVRVLTATAHGFAPEVEALWVSMLGSLAAEATAGEQKLFAGASHSLETEHPHEVADAILSLVSSRETK